MAVANQAGEIGISQSSAADYPVGSLRFDLLVAVVSVIFLFGLFLDGWAHNHGQVDNSFFTPWHAVFYGGYALTGAVIVITHFRNVGRGHRWLRALPKGYSLSLVGVGLFALAGVGDMLWHETFGIEENLEALLSPTHLLLASSMFLIFTGPLLAAWHRASDNPGWRELFPAIAALTCLLSLMTFMTQYSHLLSRPMLLVGSRRGAGDFADIVGITDQVLPAALMVGVLLFALRRWRLPFGAATLIFTGHILLMQWMLFYRPNQLWISAAAVIGGLVADILIWQLKPSPHHPLALRLFSFVVPFTIVLVYMLVLNTFDPRGLWWQVHMWLGVPFVAGIAGLFLSVIAAPPPLPESA